MKPVSHTGAFPKTEAVSGIRPERITGIDNRFAIHSCNRPKTKLSLAIAKQDSVRLPRHVV